MATEAEIQLLNRSVQRERGGDGRGHRTAVSPHL